MPNSRLPFQNNTYYHIYNRGYLKNKIFYGSDDYKRFIKKLRRYSVIYEDIVDIVQFCILPNHFHILLKNKKEGLILADFMRRLQVSHAIYFKLKYGGLNGLDYNRPIFESRYKAKIIEDETYLNKVKYYIANNPAKHGYVENSNEWNWKFQDRS